MVEVTQLPTSAEKPLTPVPVRLDPFESLRREVDRLFDDFHWAAGRMPFISRPFGLAASGLRRGDALIPPVDVAEKDGAYEISAELPGLSEADIEVKAANGTLTIKGEKKEETETHEKDYHLSERRYGSFVRSFRLPEGVDTDKIEAVFAKGVLTVTLPKTAQARQDEKKIDVKAA